jgi:hypothetical protein
VRAEAVLLVGVRPPAPVVPVLVGAVAWVPGWPVPSDLGPSPVVELVVLVAPAVALAPVAVGAVPADPGRADWPGPVSGPAGRWRARSPGLGRCVLVRPVPAPSGGPRLLVRPGWVVERTLRPGRAPVAWPLASDAVPVPQARLRLVACAGPGSPAGRSWPVPAARRAKASSG